MIGKSILSSDHMFSMIVKLTSQLEYELHSPHLIHIVAQLFKLQK